MKKSLFAEVSPTDVRTMEIPRNRLGLGEGTWLRWPELEAWLRGCGLEEAADDLCAAIQSGATVAAREVTLRG